MSPTETVWRMAKIVWRRNRCALFCLTPARRSTCS